MFRYFCLPNTQRLPLEETVTRAQLSWERGNIWLQPPFTLNILGKEKTQLQIYQAFLFQLKGGRGKQTNKQTKTKLRSICEGPYPGGTDLLKD